MAKRFKWRLDSVKQAKERKEDQKKVALGEAQNSLHVEEGNRTDLEVLRKEQRDRLRANQSGKLNALDLQASHAYISDLNQKLEAQQKRIEAARQIAEIRRAELVKAVQENKVLENLRTRDYTAFKKNVQKREQMETDETANRSAHRKRQQEESET